MKKRIPIPRVRINEATDIFDIQERIEPLLEMGMSASKLSDKYGEVVSSIIDNMVCICLYPDCPTIKHWKERITGLCNRFANMNIDPIKNNTFDYRLKILMVGVVETLDADYGALLNHFKNVSGYYANKKDKHDRLFPYKPYDICYEENKDRIISAIKNVTIYVAEQDLTKISKYMQAF